jgi:hypothetical protein
MKYPRTLTLLFLPAFALGQLSTSVIAAYGLGWYDRKWGSPWGAVQMDMQLLPVFLLPALAGYLLGLAAAWTRLPSLSPPRLAVRVSMIGFVAPLLTGVLFYLEQRAFPATAFARVIGEVSLGWLVIIPALLSALLLPMRRRRVATLREVAG